MSDFTSKGGEKIEKGDTVHTPIRGGKHEGQVEELVTDDTRAKEIDAKGAKSAPAVVFTDQNQKKVAHKPNSLSNLDKE
ncbi:uncharacterized protein HMPREF1541_03689 [Cyphellophora europaea CBS 101466]|uniref:Hypervirulence associated protein TUDOR domain-containing protein n=1 Tax=Cyphellophora europaea (strain CBS 101466) TaxID=1220924 RepID=W2RZ72_CYPE1|nr:uncharacterized protein HMPREF1541_03689 [Cyphellophora europaea CBS 101466]ETN41752.1 hypothetical protein HMPREF1541_03689 [Cyphellophora europaea CBS 101466]